jgi:hypothetical protein
VKARRPATDRAALDADTGGQFLAGNARLRLSMHSVQVCSSAFLLDVHVPVDAFRKPVRPFSFLSSCAGLL